MVEATEQKLGEKNVGDNVACAVFQEWLTGAGKKPVSWDTLANVLKDMKLETLAEAVRISKCGSTSERKASIVSIEHMFKYVMICHILAAVVLVLLLLLQDS